MRYTTVRDVMTSDVVTVTPTTPYKEILRRLAQHHISAVPVIDPDRRPIGIVSETDPPGSRKPTRRQPWSIPCWRPRAAGRCGARPAPARPGR